MSVEQILREKFRTMLNEEFGGVVNQMARNTGVVQSSLDRYFKKDHGNMSLENVSKLLDYSGGRIVFDATSGPDYAFIRKVAARPSAGGGSLETSDETERLLAFRRDWLSSKTTSSPEKISAMVVQSESMHPVIGKGDLILVDEGEAGQALIDGKIYVVRYEGEIFVKRFRKGAGRLLFMSENQDMKYLDFEVHERELLGDGFKNHGRVLWVGREL